jgi:two-component system, NarL family, response regulator NreC
VSIRVIIADDHAIVRAGLRALIKEAADLELVGEATGGTEALDLVEKLQPQVLVLDISMLDMDGIAVTRRVKELYPNTRILILTVHEDEALLREAIKAGASGYILKHAAEIELISAIRSVLRGDLYIHPTMIRSLFKENPPSPVDSFPPTEELTPREIEVLRLIVQGYTNRQVADELGISTRTVEGHRANLTEKLGIRSRVDLLRYARERGWV